MKKLEHLTPDQLTEHTVEYKRYRRNCVKIGIRPLPISAWANRHAPQEVEAVVAPAVEEAPVKKPKAKKEEREVILDEIFELTPEPQEQPQEQPPAEPDPESIYFK